VPFRRRDITGAAVRAGFEGIVDEAIALAEGRPRLRD
jgi:hypothetical protein